MVYLYQTACHDGCLGLLIVIRQCHFVGVLLSCSINNNIGRYDDITRDVKMLKNNSNSFVHRALTILAP